MPNQSDPNQSQPQAPTSAPGQTDQTKNQVPTLTGTEDQKPTQTFSPAMDLPPLPPDFQGVEESAQTATPSTAQANDNKGSTTPPQTPGSAAPPETPPIITTPKKKFGGKRIIATILGVLLLVGGVGAGYILTQQPQLFQQKASIPIGTTQEEGTVPAPHGDQTGGGGGNNNDEGSGGSPTTSGPAAGEFGYVYSPTGDNGQPYVAGTYIAPNNERYLVQSPGTFEAAAQYLKDNPEKITELNFAQSVVDRIDAYLTSGVDPYGGSSGPINCTGSGYGGFKDGTVSEPCQGGGYLIEKIATTGCPSGQSECWCTVDSTNCTTSTNTNESPPPTPNVTASCLNVKAYDETWNPLNSADLSALTTGDKVNFCVAGSASSGAFDKAQFKIGTTTEPETITKRPSSTDYCQGYTILATDTTVNVLAKIHHATLGWFGETF